MQDKNEKYFSLAAIYTASRRANLSIGILSDLIFTNKNSTALGRNIPIDVFGGSLDAVADIVDEMESNPDTFADASETDCFNYLDQLYPPYPPFNNHNNSNRPEQL